MSATHGTDDPRAAPRWERLSTLPSAVLGEARLQLHHAAQIIVSAPISYLPPQPDDGHTNLEWLPALGVLATRPLPSPDDLRFALRVSELALCAVAGGAQRACLPLEGRTLAEGVAWVAAALQRAGFDDARLTTRKHYEIPGHAVATGAPFGASAHALDELAHAYHDAWLLTTALAAREPGASPPRCWPHHFDLATLITLPAAPDGVTPTIGVGLSPGDEWYADPYLYVGPYPHPAVTALPALPRGHWHTAGWVGAVRELSAVAAVGDGPAQADDASRFVSEAVAACRQVLRVT
ncbi:MAG TPA: hypothetical protein VLE53_01310 [Gemmatimonadaceae bacterium]|nr:hypothetical protein [Gemmatimonadaceae bacterium]